MPLLAALAYAGTTVTLGCAPERQEGPKADVQRNCGGVPPDTTPLRRMTATQFEHTVHDLFGDDVVVDGFPDSQPSETQFSTDATANVVSDFGIQAMFYAVEDVARQVSGGDLATLLPCDPAAVDDTCVVEFVETFGARAYRRPLTSQEVESAAASWSGGPADATTAERLESLLAVFLFSPQFLYVTQGGGDPSDRVSPDGAELLRLTDWEIASRLSYALWDTMPDEALFAAARAGELHEPSQVREHALRMLEDERARPVIARFHAEWLGIENLENVTKSEVAHPGWDAALAADLLEENRRFVLGVFDGSGRFADLIGGEGARDTFLNGRVAAHYGVPGGSGPDDWAPASYPETRAGVLTQGAFLAAHADSVLPNPIKRGAFVQRHVMCDPIPAPPPGIPVLGEPSVGQTRRDVLEAHRENAACASCHDRIDPSGLALETFDAIGTWRTEDNGVRIDPAGTMPTIDDEDLGSFGSARELVDLLATSRVAHECYAETWFHYVTGEQVVAEDACAAEAAGVGFVRNEGDIRALIADLVSSPSFLHRLAPEEI